MYIPTIYISSLHNTVILSFKPTFNILDEDSYIKALPIHINFEEIVRLFNFVGGNSLKNFEAQKWSSGGKGLNL